MNLKEHINVYLLHHTLTEGVIRFPDKPVVVERDRDITYSQLFRSAGALARTLRSRGVSAGVLVGLYLPKSIESVIAMFGVLMCGGAYVPIDPKAPGSRVRTIISNCRIPILIASDTLLKRNFPDKGELNDLECLVVTGVPEAREPDGRTPNTVLWQEALDNEPLNSDAWIGSDCNTAYILHTSGSTGEPKGVIISHLNALTFVRTAIESFDLTASDRFACHAPLHFDLTVFDIYVSISLGATLILIPDNLSVFPLKLSEYIRNERVTVWNSVSSVLSMIADKGCHGDQRFEDIRLVVFSGEVLPVKYLLKLKDYMANAVFCSIYGQTEANSSTCYVVDSIPQDPQWKIPVGKPLPNFEVFLLDEKGEEVLEPGREGEIYVKGSTVALGYFRNPGLTSDKFPEDPRLPGSAARVYKTGDMAVYDENSDLVFIGRRDNMVKVRGHRVELGEIEQCLGSHSDVRLAIAVAVPDENFTNRIFSFVSFQDGTTVEPEHLAGFCARSLPPYMVPENVWVVEKFPLTPNDKIDRKYLTKKAIQLVRS